MLMPYVHGRAQPVGKLMTRDAFQRRLGGGLLVLHTGVSAPILPLNIINAL